MYIYILCVCVCVCVCVVCVYVLDTLLNIFRQTGRATLAVTLASRSSHFHFFSLSLSVYLQEPPATQYEHKYIH